MPTSLSGIDFHDSIGSTRDAQRTHCTQCTLASPKSNGLEWAERLDLLTDEQPFTGTEIRLPCVTNSRMALIQTLYQHNPSTRQLPL